MMQAQLGMIPSWQYSQDPGVNIKLNPDVVFPEGWTQRTVQPVGAYNTARIAMPDLGRSGTDCVCDSGREWCCTSNTITSRFKRAFGMRGLGAESWAYENRRGLLIGGISLMAAAALGFAALKK